MNKKSKPLQSVELTPGSGATCESGSKETEVVQLQFLPAGNRPGHCESDRLKAVNAMCQLALAIVTALGGTKYRVHAHGEPPSEIGSGYALAIQATAGFKPTAGDVKTATSQLQETLFRFFEDLDLAASSVALGDQIASLIATHELAGPAKILPAKMNQAGAVALDDEYNLRVAKDPRAHVKTMKRVVTCVGQMTGVGYTVGVNVAGRTFALAAVAQKAMTATFVAHAIERKNSQCSGYHRHHRAAELRFGKRSRVLTAPAGEGDLLEKAAKADKAVDVDIGVSKPSNPVLPHADKLQLVHVAGVGDPPGQLELEGTSEDDSDA